MANISYYLPIAMQDSFRCCRVCLTLAGPSVFKIFKKKVSCSAYLSFWVIGSRMGQQLSTKFFFAPNPWNPEFVGQKEGW